MMVTTPAGYVHAQYEHVKQSDMEANLYNGSLNWKSEIRVEMEDPSQPHTLAQTLQSTCSSGRE